MAILHSTTQKMIWGLAHMGIKSAFHGDFHDQNGDLSGDVSVNSLANPSRTLSRVSDRKWMGFTSSIIGDLLLETTVKLLHGYCQYQEWWYLMGNLKKLVSRERNSERSINYMYIYIYALKHHIA